jgi:positive regulator of sigma E activity
MMNLNWQPLLFLFLGVLVGSMIAVNKPDGQELLGLLSGAAIGALVVFGYQRWAKR